MTHTAAATVDLLSVAAANCVEEHAAILPEPADATKEERSNSRNSRATIVAGEGVPVVISTAYYGIRGPSDRLIV